METQELLLEDYPIRRTHRQRERFLSFVKTYSESLGWRTRLLRSGTSVCLLIGNETDAKIGISACYETPGQTLVPASIYPAARVITLLIRFLPLIVTVLVFPIAAFAARTGFTLTILEILFLSATVFFTLRLFIQPSNRENCNCNSSGCSVLLDLLKAITANNRKKVVFLLWDRPDVERNGFSRTWKSDPSVASLPFVHLSCLGYGNRVLLLQKKSANPEINRKEVLRTLKRRGAQFEVPVETVAVRRGILCGSLRNSDSEICAVTGSLPFSRIQNTGTRRDVQYNPDLLVMIAGTLRTVVESI